MLQTRHWTFYPCPRFISPLACLWLVKRNNEKFANMLFAGTKNNSIEFRMILQTVSDLGWGGETKPLPLCDLHKNPQVGGWMKHFETKWKSLLKFPGYRTKSFLIKFVILQVVFFISMYPGTGLLLETGKGNLFEEQRNIQKQFTKYLVILLLLYLMGQCLRRNWGFIQNKKRKLQSNLLSIFIVWKNYYSPSFQQMNKTFHYSKVWKCAAKYLSTSVALQFSSVHLTRKRGGAAAFTSMSMGSRVHRRLCMWLK